METTQVIVVGAGPGGYTTAFRAADLGMKVTLIDPEIRPGGVCLHRGCIPSKALLHVAQVIRDGERAREWGVDFGGPSIDLGRVRAFKNSVVEKITTGLGQLTGRREIDYFQGTAAFVDSNTIRVSHTDGSESDLAFKNCVLSPGSRPNAIPGLESDRVMSSTEALELSEVPAKMLVVGGGYIGLELGCIYAALGSEITVAEMLETPLADADRDLVRPLAGRLAEIFNEVKLSTKVVSAEDSGSGVEVTFEDGEGGLTSESFDRILVSAGRTPNTDGLRIENTDAVIGDDGFIEVDAHRRTADEKIFAVGDVTGGPMLAHKATREGLIAAEVIAGYAEAVFSPKAIPSVVYTDPEIAWCGLTETEARKNGVKVKVVRFPWAASGRASTADRADGLTKLVIEPGTETVLGVGVVGVGAGELIAEGVLAIEMEAKASDLARTIH
ncbi:MAG: dihydrolipoyl dehydrogenase, partial [Candidatus Latescibacteria bacterium]|nr:dihydrolipoyl dehydrogenase [Candidatus Latescibacterota bacterium]